MIRSFLFLTNDGPPEGRKLRALTGLAKYDKKYLGIDKLSTFTAYRIHEDEALSALCQGAGCSSLLDSRNLEAIAAEYTPPRDRRPCVNTSTLINLCELLIRCIASILILKFKCCAKICTFGYKTNLQSLGAQVVILS